MKTIGTALIAAFVLMTAISCVSPREEPLTLTLSAEEVSTSETVYFTVHYGEMDVTDEARIFLRSTNEELKDACFSTTVPGEYEFYAAYNDVISDFIKVTVRGDATLAASTSMIAADGTDVVEFTVIQDGEDVTDESILYLIPDSGEPVAQEGFVFSTKEKGVYSFYARRGAASTNQVSVIALTRDSEPENVNFKERAMLTEFTGTWCGNCSLVKAVMYELEDEDWGDGVVIEAHDGDVMTTEYVTNLIKDYGAHFTAYPHVTYNMDNQHSSTNYGDISVIRQYVLKNTDQVISAFPCTAGISAAFERGSGEELTVYAGFKFTDPGEYRIAVWLLENDIEVSQTNNYPSLVADEYISTHRNVLRDVSNGKEFTGDDISITESMTYKFETWTFDMSSLCNGKPENSLVAVFVTKKQANGSYVVNNIIKCHFGETVGFEYSE